MGTVAIPFAVGDTTWVTYPVTEGVAYFTPQSRVIKKIDVTGSGNVSTIHFTNGRKVVDSDASQTLYATQALAAAAIITDVISQSAATCVLDVTTSAASTASQASVTLGRIG